MLSVQRLDQIFKEYEAMLEEDRSTVVNFLAALADYFKLGDAQLFSDNFYYDNDEFLEELPPSWREKMEQKMKEVRKAGTEKMMESECDAIVRAACKHAIEDFYGAHLDESTKQQIFSKIGEELSNESRMEPGNELQVTTWILDKFDVRLDYSWVDRHCVLKKAFCYRIWFDGDKLKMEKIGK